MASKIIVFPLPVGPVIKKKLQTLKLNQEDFLKQLKKLEKDYQEKKVQADFLDYKQQTKEKLQNQIQETKQLINQIYQ